MTDDDLRQTLRDLARTTASPDFTRATLRRLDEAERRRLEPAPGPGARWALAATALLVAAGLAVVRLNLPAPSAEPGEPIENAAQQARLEVPSATPLLERPASRPPTAEPASPFAPSPARQAQIDRLRREYAAIERELEALRRVTEQEAPVLYVEGSEDLDLVLDLRHGRPGVLPTAYRPAAVARF